MATLDLRRPGRTRRRGSFRCAVVPLSDGPECELVVDLACRLAADHGTVVALFPVELELEFPLDAPAREEDARAHAVVERALAIGSRYGVHVVPRIVHTRSRSDVILEEAVRRRADVIVLPLTRGKQRSLDFLLKHAPCRVLLASLPAE